jgi:hypothetical protein
VQGSPTLEKNEVAAELRGEGRGRWRTSGEGGRGGEATARAPRAAVAGSPAGGGCGGGLDHECGGDVPSLRPRFWWAAVLVLLIFFNYFPASLRPCPF